MGNETILKNALYKDFGVRNRTWGIDKRFFDDDDLKILKGFAKYVRENNIKSNVEIVIVSTDRYKVINRINIYIENDKYDIAFKNVYIGGVYGTDRIFECLYNFEYLLGDLIKEKFEHYVDYSLSNKYTLL